MIKILTSRGKRLKKPEYLLSLGWWCEIKGQFFFEESHCETGRVGLHLHIPCKVMWDGRRDLVKLYNKATKKINAEIMRMRAERGRTQDELSDMQEPDVRQGG